VEENVPGLFHIQEFSFRKRRISRKS